VSIEFFGCLCVITHDTLQIFFRQLRRLCNDYAFISIVVNDRRTSDINHHHASSSAASNTTADPLSVQVSTFVATIEALLEKHNDKLEPSKRICLDLKANNTGELLFNDEQLQKISAFTTFNELFMMLRKYWSYTEYSILKQIIAIANLGDAKDELKRFEKRMGSIEGMKLISETILPEEITHEYVIMKVIIDKPYQELTLEEFTRVRNYIFDHLETKHYVALPHIKFLIGSLQLQWYVLKKAAPHMIKMAQHNEEIFVNNKVVFIQVDEFIVFDNRAKGNVQMVSM